MLMSTASLKRPIRAPSCPHWARPSRQRVDIASACAATERPFRSASAGVDPRLEVARPKLGKGEHEIPEVPFGVDAQGGDAVDRRFFEQRQAEAGFAAAGHPDADRVGREVLRVVENRNLIGL